MSRKTGSSAPCSLYLFASSTVLPAYLRSTNSTLLTTVIPFSSRVISRHRMIFCEHAMDNKCSLVDILPSSHTSITAMIPVRKTPSKVPAPPMLATGAPRSLIFPRFRMSAPISVPSVPLV